MEFNIYKKIWVFGILIFLYISTFLVMANDFERISMDDGSISGHVNQVNGAPIGDATVEVIRLNGPGLWDTTTFSSGRYFINDLPVGDYKIRAYKSGYAREYYDNVFYSNEADILHIEESEGISDIDFILTLGGAISGYISNDNSGEPIEDAIVNIRSSNYFMDDGFETITDSNGLYLIDCLPIGNYKVRSSASGYALSRYYDDVYGWDKAIDVRVNPPQETSGINISMELAGGITGYVFADDGIMPISNVGVIVDSGLFEGIGTMTNEDGSYLLHSLPPVRYVIRTGEDLPGWYAAEFYDSKLSVSEADWVYVNAGEITAGINFTLDEGGWISGYVYDEKTYEPISGVQVGATLSYGDWVSPVPWTNFEGKYKLSLKEGDYYINVVNVPNYIPEFYDNSSDIENADLVSVSVRTETSGINFYLSQVGSISGIIYDEDLNPIEDASIYAFSDEFPGNGAVSKQDGSYKIEGLPSGEYLVQVTVSGFNPEYYDDVTDPEDATLVNVNAPNDTTGIDFILSIGIDVYVSRPEKGHLYLFDNDILILPIDLPIAIGSITIRAVAFGSDNVEFYIDDNLQHTDDDSPFSWSWNELSFGKRSLKVVVYEGVDVVSDEIEIWKFL